MLQLILYRIQWQVATHHNVLVIPLHTIVRVGLLTIGRVRITSCRLPKIQVSVAFQLQLMELIPSLLLMLMVVRRLPRQA